MNMNSRYVSYKNQINIFLGSVYACPTKYPQEKILGPRNNHKVTMELDPRDPRNFPFSSKIH